MIVIYKMPFIFSITFIVVGVILKIVPPKSSNPFYGYKTPRSMKSKEHWDFAQVLASKRSIQVGVLLLFFSFSRMLTDTITSSQQIIGVFIILLLFFLVIELELKNKFK